MAACIGTADSGHRSGARPRRLVAVTAAACLLLTGCGASPVKDEGAGTTFCANWGPGRTYTDAADYLTTSRSATIVSVRAVGATNMVIVDAVLVPMLDKDGAVGNGTGLPTEAGDGAASLAPRSWPQRRYLPATITGAHKWQLVYGLRVLGVGTAVVNGALVRIDAGRDHWTLHSQLFFGVSAPGRSDDCPGLKAG